LALVLSADERSRLRGQRRSLCGQELLLQLDRGAPLQPGEWLSGAGWGPAVQVLAAPEALLRVRAQAPLELLQAAYHLGNRHVALELRATELRLLDDPVLADLLGRRGLLVDHLQEPFRPEAGAYGSAHGQGSAHGHG
jgi:urease accessory protein